MNTTEVDLKTPTYEDNLRGAEALLAQVREGLTATQVAEVESFLSAGEPKMALEFTIDFIVENDTPLSAATFAFAEALAHGMGTKRGLHYIRNLVMDTGAD